jgi:hypothetical protein
LRDTLGAPNALEEFRALGIEFVGYRKNVDYRDGAGQAHLWHHGQPGGI